MFDKYPSQKANNLLLFFFIICLPVLLFYYFLIIKTAVIYGDDLNIFMAHSNLKTFSEKINLSLPSQKYRPVHDFVMHFMIVIFQKHIGYYYLFNIAIQTLNTFLFAAIVNLFLRSAYLSLFFSLIVGLSRFAFFNISQLYNGGALEGLAMTFFFLSLYFLLKILVFPDLHLKKQKSVLLSLLFANLSMYTHERYIVLIPFIVIVIFSFGTKILGNRQKIFLSLLAVLSIILNVVIKKYVYSIPFFVGTAGTNISFSFTEASTFFIQAVCSIFEINLGPDYLVGMQFSNLSFICKALVLLLNTFFLYILFSYLYKVIKLKLGKEGNNIITFICLILLFGLCLAPAIVTIRLEQRWLQASFSIFVLLIVIAVSKIEFKSNYQKNLSLSLFIFLFLGTDAMYFYLGNKNVYMSNAATAANSFKAAIDNDIIHSNSSKLFIWESIDNINNENAINWELGGGDFFSFYQNKSKKIIFVDSVYQKSQSPATNPLLNFDKNYNQILFIDQGIVDITNDYLKDSLKVVNINSLSTKILYNQNKLVIKNANLNEFVVKGFYAPENAITWTNGNVNIGFLGNFLSKDTLRLKLTTYMPPICKNIFPKIELKDIDNTIYQSISSRREGDIFYYNFYAIKSINIQAINITSDLIDASPDKRILSFPFISLELRH